VQGLNSNRTIFTNEFKSQSIVISRLHMSMKDHVTNEHIQTRNVIAQALRESQNTGAVVDNPVHNTQYSDALPTQEAQQYILDSLEFETMRDRYEAISEAHDKTFNWIFQADMGEDTKWSNYAKWLREGEGIYWVNGKAGSGKSTLMRYIVEDWRTRRMLEYWARRDKKLITTNFFFWKSGAIDQASQLGLLRSLMFEILTIIPSMMPSVFPEEWKETLKILRSGGSRRKAGRQRNQLKRWTLKAIKKGFEILFGQYIGKVCLFIDGIDEYEGDPMDTVELFRSITSSNVKICLSSRPWVVFENAFEERPKLRLQDLTHHDIRLYVNDKLHKDPRMQKLYLSEPEEAPKLISEIVRKADGVFLWVMLVARSLLSGLNNSDQISDLQKRLRLLPSEIEDLYKYMLAQIELVYFEEGSRIFQLMATAYTHEGSGKRNLCAIGVSFAEDPDPSLVFKCRDELLSEVEVQSRVLRVDRRLRLCCAGILELSSSDTKEMLQERGNMRVEYIHRTARDFLDTPETRTKILKATEDTGFEPHVALFRSNILLLKTCCFTTSQQWGWDRGAFAEYTMELARAAESATEQLSIELLYELDRVAGLGWETFKVSPEYDPTDHVTSESDCWVDQIFHGYDRPYPWHDDFLSLAITYGLRSFVACKLLAGHRVVKQKKGRPYLDYAIKNTLDNPVIVDPTMVALLFRYGANPNQMAGPIWTVWQDFLLETIGNLSTSIDHIATQVQIFELFLKHGADPNTFCETYDKWNTAVKHSVSEIVKIVLADFPKDVKKILTLLAERQNSAVELMEAKGRRGILKRLRKNVGKQK